MSISLCFLKFAVKNYQFAISEIYNNIEKNTFLRFKHHIAQKKFRGVLDTIDNYAKAPGAIDYWL